MSQATIQSLIEQVRNETQLHGNTRERIASLLTQLNSEKTDRADVESIISEITNLSPLFFDQFGNILDSLTAGWTVQFSDEEYIDSLDGRKVIRKVTGYVGGTGTLPTELSDNVGKYFAKAGGFTTSKADATIYETSELLIKEAKQGSAPTPYNAVTYPDGLFEKYQVKTPLTLPNSWGSAVTQAELDANYIFFDVRNGVVTKELSKKPEVDAKNEIIPDDENAINSIAVLKREATEKYLNGFRSVMNLYDKDNSDQTDLNAKYFFNNGNAVGDLGGWFISDYIRCFPEMIFTMSKRRFVMFYDENKNFINGNDSIYDQTLTAPPNAYFFRFDWKISEKALITILEGNIVQNYIAYLQPKDYRFNDVPYKKIIAVRNANDYNSIRELAEDIAPFSNEFNRYEIFVNIGEWREMDWQGWGDYVKIVGQNMSSTKIICDGLWTDAKYKTDNLFPYEAYRNKTFAQVWNDLGSPRFLHIIFAKKSLYAENLSFEGNNLKYILHCDNPNYKTVNLKNVAFKQRSSNYIMGNGINGGQSIVLENFIADNDPNPIKTDHAFYHHTWGNQKEGSLLHLINGTFKNGGVVLLGEAGSEQQDDVIIENCKGDEMKVMWSVPEWTAGKSLWQNEIGQLETNPIKVPYCIYVWDKGTGITANEDNQAFSGHTGDVRPGRANYVI